MSAQLLFDRFRKGKLLSGVLTLSSATVISQLIAVASMPLLTRIYSPNDFGLFATFSGLASVLLVSSSLRYEFAIPIASNDGNARLLVLATQVLNILFGGLVLIAVFLFGHKLATLAGMPEVAKYSWLLAVFVICAGWYKTFNFWAIRHKRFGDIGRTKVVQSFANVLVMLASGLCGLGALGLILGQLVGQTVGGMTLARGANILATLPRRRATFARIRLLLQRYRRFPAYDAPAALLDNFAIQLPNLMLASLFDTRVAGWYMLAARVLYLPMQLVGQAIGQVLLGMSREAIKNGTIQSLLKKIVAALVTAGFVPAVLVCLMAGPIFGWVFGQSWHEAGLYASWMVAGIAVQFVYSPISVVLMATNGQQLNLRIQSTMFLVRSGALFFGFLDGRPIVAIIALSLVTAAGYAGSIYAIIRHVKAVAQIPSERKQ